MSRENYKKYPRSVESKNSFLRIRAPENLDIALEGLIRKVLREQPKMDDIYTFAADYFDMLLRIREKAGIRKLSAQDICPYHNEDDAHEMVKLASSFIKRTKPQSNTYKALALRNQSQSKSRQSPGKIESKDLEAVGKKDEGFDKFENKLSFAKENTEKGKTKDESNESGSTENETVYSIKVSGQEIGEEVFIRANEVVTEYNAEDEDSPRDISGNGAETVGDINELRDKIRAVENEIKRMDNKEDKIENDTTDENIAREGLGKGTNELGSSDENLEESKSGRSTEDVEGTGTSLAIETEVEENSVEATSQEDQKVKHDKVEQTGDTYANAKNDDALDEKFEGQEDIRINEESPKPDVESELKYVESAAQDVNADAAEKAEKMESNTEVIGEETQSEAEEVKSSGNDAQKVEETSLEKQTENKETEEENPTGILGQDEALQEKEKEDNMESEILIEGEREAMKVPDSEVTDMQLGEREDVNPVNENLEVREGDTLVSSEIPDESSNAEKGEKIEKESVDGAGGNINGTYSAAPVLVTSALNGMEKNVEEAIEESSAAEKILLRDDLKDPAISIATRIENFLDAEREHSSNEKGAMTDGNSVESKIVARAISELGTIKENEELLIPEDDTSEKASGITEDPKYLEPDNQEGSTTSDEIEFETSPAKYPETDILVTTTLANRENAEMQKEIKAETKIILELNTEDQESEVQAEEYKNVQNRVLLEVPELKLDENIVRKSERKTIETEPVVEEPEDEGVPICGNVGNEIIQKGEVEKVELVEGEEDILQVHLTTTVETEQDTRNSVNVEMTSKIDPDFRVHIETKLESPVQDGGNTEKMQLIRAAVIIQNGFRRFKNKKIFEERKQHDKQLNNEDASNWNENESTAPITTFADSRRDSNPSLEEEPKGTLNLTETRTLVESQSLDSLRKISPLKTRSLSSVCRGAADFEVWNQLVKELEEAATKIQSNYRGYKSRKKLQRENAIQSTTTTSEDSTYMADPEINHRHTGEFHDSLVLPLDPK